VDCGNGSCKGGDPRGAVRFAALYGLTTQSAYPYTAKDGECMTKTGSYKISGAVAVSSSEASHQSAVAQKPFSVCVDASNFGQYKSGIFSNCGTNPNHAITLFGYGSGFWIVKNSWGTGWGENGYMRLKDGNTCGILSYSTMAK